MVKIRTTHKQDRRTRSTEEDHRNGKPKLEQEIQHIEESQNGMAESENPEKMMHTEENQNGMAESEDPEKILHIEENQRGNQEENHRSNDHQHGTMREE